MRCLFVSRSRMRRHCRSLSAKARATIILKKFFLSAERPWGIRICDRFSFLLLIKKNSIFPTQIFALKIAARASSVSLVCAKSRRLTAGKGSEANVRLLGSLRQTLETDFWPLLAIRTESLRERKADFAADSASCRCRVCQTRCQKTQVPP